MNHASQHLIRGSSIPRDLREDSLHCYCVLALGFETYVMLSDLCTEDWLLLCLQLVLQLCMKVAASPATAPITSKPSVILTSSAILGYCLIEVTLV